MTLYDMVEYLYSNSGGSSTGSSSVSDVIYLGNYTGSNTINVYLYVNDWENITEDNLILDVSISSTANGSSTWSATNQKARMTATVTKSYDATTGQLSVVANSYAVCYSTDYSTSNSNTSCTIQFSYDVYYISGYTDATATEEEETSE